MGSKITKFKPVGGFCAETAGAMTLFSTALAGIHKHDVTIRGQLLAWGGARSVPPFAGEWRDVLSGHGS